MPPAKPAKKRASKAAKAKGRPKPEPKAGPNKKATCHTCGSRIRVPDGWSIGPAVRRHYWARHRDVMQPDPKRRAR